jgi:myo-inositol-1(or 4)-monophosphatase
VADRPGRTGEYGELLALAVDVAAGAADLIRERRRGVVEVSGTKSSPTDIVTEVDKAAERLIFDRLTTARPGDGFVGEEGASATASSGVEWIVDPIDGTVNFVYGIPAFAVSIAAAVDGESVAGVVLDVVSGERFTATRGGGAFCTGTRGGGASNDATRLELPVSGSPKPLSQRLVGTGFSYVPEVKARQVVAVSAMMREVRDLRRIGSAALDLCFVAAGRFDAYVEEGLNPWDMAAGGLVATEAGAILESAPGVGGKQCFWCAPAEGFAEFSALVRASGFLASPE